MNQSKTNQIKKPYEMPILKKKEYDDGLKITVYSGKNDEQWFDIRYFHEGNPTKRGIRLRKAVVTDIISIHEELDDTGFNIALTEVIEEKKKELKESFKTSEKMLGQKKKKVVVEDDVESATVSDIDFPKKMKK